MDIGRDYALIFEEVLRKEKVKTRVDLRPGLPHGFWSFFPAAGFSRNVEEMMREGLRWWLENGRPGKALMGFS